MSNNDMVNRVKEAMDNMVITDSFGSGINDAIRKQNLRKVLEDKINLDEEMRKAKPTNTHTRLARGMDRLEKSMPGKEKREAKKDNEKKKLKDGYGSDPGDGHRGMDEASINEAMKLLATHGEGSKVAKVYRDKEWDEYRVKHFVDGKHQEKADYHTNDKEDAHSTAKHWVSKSVKEESLHEVSKKVLSSYFNKAIDSVEKKSKEGGPRDDKKMEKRTKYMVKAVEKMDEETPIDEGLKDVLKTAANVISGKRRATMKKVDAHIKKNEMVAGKKADEPYSKDWIGGIGKTFRKGSQESQKQLADLTLRVAKMKKASKPVIDSVKREIKKTEASHIATNWTQRVADKKFPKFQKEEIVSEADDDLKTHRDTLNRLVVTITNKDSHEEAIKKAEAQLKQEDKLTKSGHWSTTYGGNAVKVKSIQHAVNKMKAMKEEASPTKKAISEAIARVKRKSLSSKIDDLRLKEREGKLTSKEKEKLDYYTGPEDRSKTSTYDLKHKK